MKNTTTSLIEAKPQRHNVASMKLAFAVAAVTSFDDELLPLLVLVVFGTTGLFDGDGVRFAGSFSEAYLLAPACESA